MAILNFFKKPQESILTSPRTPGTSLQLEDFSFYYLYGFSNHPNRTSDNVHAFRNLYQLVIGSIGGVCIANSFHPYRTINSKGLTAWTDAYIKVAINNNNEKTFRNIKQEQAVYTIGASPVFNEVNIWPDTRLTFEENPAFSKYVPFIIPFLVLKTAQTTNWDNAMRTDKALKGYGAEYMEQVTNAIRFFMPAPAFVLGFGEFDGTNPASLIDKFMACKPMFGYC